MSAPLQRLLRIASSCLGASAAVLFDAEHDAPRAVWPDEDEVGPAVLAVCRRLSGTERVHLQAPHADLDAAGLGFFASVPMDDQGALCVVGPEAQAFDATAWHVLDDLAATAETLTERKRHEVARRHTARLLAQARQIANLGSWSWDATKEEAVWSSEMYRIFDLDPDLFDGRTETFIELRVHPEDRPLFTEHWRKSFEQGFTEPFEYRAVHPDGEIRRIRAESLFVTDDDGTLLRIDGIVQDVTEQRRAEEALRAEQQRSEMALLGADLGSWDLDLRTGTNVVNARWAEMLGYTLDEIEPTHAFFASLVHPDDLARKEAVFEAHVQEETSFLEIELRMRAKDGSWRWILDRGTIIERDADGTPLRAVGTHLDITERKRAEHALRRSEERFRRLFEESPTGIVMAQPPNTLVEVNPAFCTMLGYDSEDLRAQPLLALTHPEDRSASQHLLDALVTGRKKSFSVEKRYLHRDGHAVWARLKATAVHGEGGHLLYVLAMIEDINSQHEAQQELARWAHRQKTLARLSQLALSENDPADVLQAACDHVLKILRVDGTSILELADEGDRLIIRAGAGLLAEAVGTTTLPLGHPDAEQLRRVLTGGQPAVIADLHDASYVDPTPTLRELGIVGGVSLAVRGANQPYGVFAVHVCTPRTFANDEVAFLRATANVLSLALERARQEHQLAEERDRAAEMSRLKSAFLANMSHEVRTPLTSILGFSDILRDEVSAAHREFVDMVRHSGRRLMETIDSVLDLAQLESGSTRMHVQPVDLYTETWSVYEVFAPQATEKALDLHVEAPAQPVRAHADRLALGRVLSNLINNAIKFTHTGSVHLELGYSGERAYVAIHDTGIGIDPAFRPHLFDEFRQASEGETRAFEGNGLGLAVARRLLDHMDGNLKVASTVGQGSTFTILLPRADAPEANTPETDAPA